MTLPRLIKKLNFVDESGNPPHRTYHFQVYGTTATSVAKSLAEAYYGPNIITPYGLLYRCPADCKSIEYNQFDVDIDYITRQTDLGTWTFDGDGTGTTQHITHSLETIEDYPTATAPPSNRVIGRTKSGDIAGTDVIVPAGKFSVTFHHTAGVVSLPYFKYLSDLAGYVNSDSFLVWAPGEVKFLGPRVSGIIGGGAPPQMTCVYNFEVQRNATGLTIGSITGVAKEGWDLFNNDFEDSTDIVGGIERATSKVQFVHIERVSYRIAFTTAFGIA